MYQPRLLSRKPGLGLRAVLSVIAGVVVATMGAAPAHALPDRASVTSGFSHQVSTIGTKPVGVGIAPAAQPSPGCDLEIIKSMSPMALVSGQQATVTLTVKNVGTATCQSGILQKATVLSDNPLSGVTLTGPPVASRSEWFCSLSGGNATCSHLLSTGLPPGYSATFTIPATVTGQGGTGLANCAQIANSADTNPDNNKSCVLLIVDHKCDLEITKTMSPTPLVSGQPATVTLTVVNRGKGECPTGFLLESTILSDNKQPGLTLTGAPVANPPGGWICSLSDGNASCARPLPPVFPPGYTTTFTIPATVTAPAGTKVTNCAEITNRDDTNPANNKSCVTKDVVSKCDLKITKTMSPTPLVSGQPATVTLTVVNVGKGACSPTALPATILRDYAAPGLTFTGQLMPDRPGWTCGFEGTSGDAGCVNNETLPKGYTAIFTMTAEVTALPGTTVTNCAQITTTGGDINPANGKSCVTKKVTR